MAQIQNPLAELRFLTDGNTIFILTTDDKTIVDTLKSGQFVFSIAIAELVEELKGKINQFTSERAYSVTVAGKKYKVTVHPDVEDGGYWVECPELPGCSSQGDSLEEALDMIKDAIKGCLEVQRELAQEKSKRVKKVA